MKEGGLILADLLDKLILCRICEGISTNKIDKEIEEYILDNSAKPVLKGYCVEGKIYPNSSCISINNEVVHGIPSSRELKDGDIVSVDVSLSYNDYYLDAARTYIVGNAKQEAKDLCNAVKESFFIGFKEFKIGNKLNKLSASIENFILEKGFKVIKDYCGHGIGKDLHEDPQVLNYKSFDNGIIIEEGLAIALEPMISIGSETTYLSTDGWTANTLDGSLAAHYENTIIATQKGPEILTMRYNSNV
jgi:methionyl aminopeptidase